MTWAEHSAKMSRDPVCTALSPITLCSRPRSRHRSAGTRRRWTFCPTPIGLQSGPGSIPRMPVAIHRNAAAK